MWLLDAVDVSCIVSKYQPPGVPAKYRRLNHAARKPQVKLSATRFEGSMNSIFRPLQALRIGTFSPCPR